MTLGADGAYGHVDHLATTRIVAAATPGPGPRVLHAVFEPGVFVPFFRRMRRFAPEILGVSDESALGDADADLVVDVSAYDYITNGDLVLFSYRGTRKSGFDGGYEKPEAQVKIIGARADIVYDDDTKQIRLTNFRP